MASSICSNIPFTCSSRFMSAPITMALPPAARALDDLLRVLGGTQIVHHHGGPGSRERPYDLGGRGTVVARRARLASVARARWPGNTRAPTWGALPGMFPSSIHIARCGHDDTCPQFALQVCRSGFRELLRPHPSKLKPRTRRQIAVVHVNILRYRIRLRPVTSLRCLHRPRTVVYPPRKPGGADNTRPPSLEDRARSAGPRSGTFPSRKGGKNRP